MQLIVNGKPHDLEVQTLPELFEALGLAGQPVAVELNETVIPKKQHPQTTLKPNDKLELVTLVGGG